MELAQKTAALKVITDNKLTPLKLMHLIYKTPNNMIELSDGAQVKWLFKNMGHVNLYLMAKTDIMKDFIEVYIESDH